MGLVSGSIRNLVQGISQQPDALRLPTQSTLQKNAYSSIVEGLKKRPPLEYLAKLKASPVSDVDILFIDRGDAVERYIAILYDTDLEVYTLGGVVKTIAFPDGKIYLTATAPSSAFRGVTVADHTFIVNKEVDCAMDTAAFSAQNDNVALVFVKQAVNGVDYTVTIDGTSYTHTTSASGAVSTAAIATALATAIGTGPDATFTVTRNNYVLKITRSNSTAFTLAVEDSRSGEALKSVMGKVQKFSSLPEVAPNNYIVEITGDNTSNFDNYYVKFITNDGSSFGEGTWEETVAPNINYQLDDTTMPHVLVREASGNFTFKKLEWGDRTAGDEDSAPDPTFVGTNIEDVFFFKNRLGFLADENVILSKVGDYYQFFPTTATTVLEDGRIDTAASHNKVSFLKHAIPYDKKLLLFSDQAQFILEDNGNLSARELPSINQTTEYTTANTVRPIPAGDNVYFASNNGDYSMLWEYFIETETSPKKAAPITSHVPTYVTSALKKLTAATTESCICAFSSTTDNKIFVHKYLWDGDEKLQNSWSEWTFDDDITILNIEFFENELYIVFTKSDGTYLGKINISPRVVDSGLDYLTHLDLKIDESDCSSVTYNSGTNTTTFTLPYEIGASADMVVVTRAGGALPEGVLLNIESEGTNTIVVTGDQSAQPVFIGCNYEMRYRFSTAFVRDSAEKGGAIVQDGRLQIRKWSVAYQDSGYFVAEVTPLYRDVSEYIYPGYTLGESGFTLGEVSIGTGEYDFPVLSKNDQVTIDLVNNTFLPCHFLSAEWTGFYVPKANQRV